MIAEHVACASLAAVEHWGQIDWKQCERQETRLQAPIVKASPEGRWGKVLCLQRLLTCSFSGNRVCTTRKSPNRTGKSPHGTPAR
jgi:RNA-directed DNA polymerase